MFTSHLPKTAEIFAGAIALWHGLPEAEGIALRTRLALRATYPEVDDPRDITMALSRDEVTSRIELLSSRLADSKPVQLCFDALVRRLGFLGESLRLDRPQFRCLPPQATGPLSRFTHTTHRDTWFGQSQSQINLWIPVYDVDASNSFEFFPSFFYN